MGSNSSIKNGVCVCACMFVCVRAYRNWGGERKSNVMLAFFMAMPNSITF